MNQSTFANALIKVFEDRVSPSSHFSHQTTALQQVCAPGWQRTYAPAFADEES